MSAFSAQQSIVSRSLEREEARKQQRQAKPQRRTIDTPAEALRTLADRNASEADRLRAWLRVGYDLGAIDLKDAGRLGVVHR